MKKENYINLQLIIKGFHPYYINRFILLFLKKIRNLNLDENLPALQVFIPKKRERFTLLRSPHVDKKARDQFERVTHKRILLLKIGIKENTILKLYRFIQNLSILSVGVSLELKYKNIKV